MRGGETGGRDERRGERGEERGKEEERREEREKQASVTVGRKGVRKGKWHMWEDDYTTMASNLSPSSKMM